jgi:methylthioribose-1-phosphate isomerase
MVVRGARDRCTAYGVALEARRHAGAARAQFDAALGVFQVLGASRPRVNLFWALGRMRQCHRKPAATPAAATARSNLRKYRGDIEINPTPSGARRRDRGQRPRLTHCNAGALAPPAWHRWAYPLGAR